VMPLEQLVMDDAIEKTAEPETKRGRQQAERETGQRCLRAHLRRRLCRLCSRHRTMGPGAGTPMF
jgi:hypothetical protein